MKASADPARTFWPALFSSAREDWATPPEVIEPLAREFGPFTLDPCATAVSAKAPKFYTLEEDGLGHQWAVDGDERVFVNPPYGRNVGAWMKKARLEAERGAVVVCLIHARTDTRWWHREVERMADLIRFIPGRIKFIGPEGVRYGAPFPSVVVVYGGHIGSRSGWVSNG